MRMLALLFATFLCPLTAPHPEVDCEHTEAVCENLAEVAKWRNKALLGMMRPEFMVDVLAEMEDVKDSDSEQSMLAAMALFEYERYFEALEGKFNEYGTTFEHSPFAVFADGEGNGFVLYPSGFGYKVGSKIKGKRITRIDSDSLVLVNERTHEIEVVTFNALYLAGWLVDEKGIGMARLPPPMSKKEFLKGWKGKK